MFAKNPLNKLASKNMGFHSIPPELFLAIVDVSLEYTRNGDSTAARRFSCVCRALRAYTMPVIYEALIISSFDCRPAAADASGPITDQDYDEDERRPLEFLSWLLLDPTAGPRKYIKYIALSCNDFSVDSVRLDTELTHSEKWVVDRLTVRSCQDAIHLYKAGIQEREVQLLNTLEFLSVPERDPFKWIAPGSGHLDDFNEDTRGHLRCWLSRMPVKEVQKIGYDDNLDNGPFLEWASRTLEGVFHRYLDPLDYHVNIAESDAHRRGQFFMIEVHGDQIIGKPDVFVRSIASILEHRSQQRVVLVHAPDDVDAASQVTSIILAAKNMLAPNLISRLSVSHTSWGRDHLLFDPIQAHCNLVRRGIDPWDEGSVPAALLAD